MPDRLQRKRTPGSRLPEGAVCVTRGTKWGNPYKAGEPITRDSDLWPYAAQLVPGGAADLASFTMLRAEDVVTAYGWWFIEQPHLMLTVREELGGKDLACWCKIGAACHADWLIDFLSELENDSDR